MAIVHIVYGLIYTQYAEDFFKEPNFLWLTLFAYLLFDIMYFYLTLDSSTSTLEPYKTLLLKLLVF